MAQSDVTIVIGKKNRRELVVSEEDRDIAENTSWHIIGKRKVLYAHRTVYKERNKGSALIHRVIMERVLGRPLLRSEHIDHINRNGLDNRRCNLRISTPQQNEWNSVAKGGSSIYKGVFFDKNRKGWCASITLNFLPKYLGTFDDEKSAALQYDQAAHFFFGDFARVNFPEVPKNSRWHPENIRTHTGRRAKWSGNRWSEHHDQCAGCGTSDKGNSNKHFALGFCNKCYRAHKARLERKRGREMGMTCRAFAAWKRAQK